MHAAYICISIVCVAPERESESKREDALGPKLLPNKQTQKASAASGVLWITRASCAHEAESIHKTCKHRFVWNCAPSKFSTTLATWEILKTMSIFCFPVLLLHYTLQCIFMRKTLLQAHQYKFSQRKRILVNSILEANFTLKKYSELSVRTGVSSRVLAPRDLQEQNLREWGRCHSDKLVCYSPSALFRIWIDWKLGAFARSHSVGAKESERKLICVIA